MLHSVTKQAFQVVAQPYLEVSVLDGLCNKDPGVPVDEVREFKEICLPIAHDLASREDHTSQTIHEPQIES